MNLAHTYTIDAAADARSLIHPSSLVWHFFLAVTVANMASYAICSEFDFGDS
jgi:hypothetical protein